MLIEFRVENHRSLRDEQVLTMEAGRVGDAADPRPRRVKGHSESLLPVAVLYGANASGKSNVLAALEFMRDAVVMSHNAWSPDEGVIRDPFAWGAKRGEPSLYEVMMLIDDVRYQYGFRTSDEAFLEEWLFAWPNGKKQIWFERDNNTFKYGDNLKGENKLIEEMTRANSLFVSAAAQNNHKMLAPIPSWFRTLRSIASPNARYNPRRTWPPDDQELARLFNDRDQEARQPTFFSGRKLSGSAVGTISGILEKCGYRDCRSSSDSPGIQLSSRTFKVETLRTQTPISIG